MEILWVHLLLWDAVSKKHNDSLFLWSPSRSSTEDADSHVTVLMRFNATMKAKAELLQAHLCPLCASYVNKYVQNSNKIEITWRSSPLKFKSLMKNMNNTLMSLHIKYGGLS